MTDRQTDIMCQLYKNLTKTVGVVICVNSKTGKYYATLLSC